MATNPPVMISRTNEVTHIRLNRPDDGNALNAAMSPALCDAITAALSDRGSCIAVTASGPRFCVGGDLGFFAAIDDVAGYLTAGARELGDAFTALTEGEKPVVVGVHGAVAGAGLALMLSGDVIIAGNGTTFASGYAGVALTPDCGTSWLLRQSIGPHRTADLLVSSRRIDAETAERWGMVTRLVDDPLVPEATLLAAAGIAAADAFAVSNARRLVRLAATEPRPSLVAEEARTIGRAIDRDEAKRAIRNFLGRQLC